ncbi:Ger(x)C family spore germination protein [Paenibacillus alginolyticus]|uniref:Ger(X)C family spore germination protein n=1 Tax=Paenibacillus alginolyticus TaxID=59839 RepID=A0ABT4G9G7_9BACL|nr:Ger(x)C family spore germination protein [Paenibacillus alginolyticus]MCY9692816.1 Ger(x)C family spore germination protein [Paenibacillus alginolyticus]MEC0148411.1 Ger(x)C family spore germination protein [Paenibacillus alginolyticus]
MTHRRRLFVFGMMITLVLTFLTGCWDRTETNDIAFVLTSSIDLEDDGKYRVTFMLPLPGSMGGASGGGGGTSGGGKSYYIDSEVGTTIRDATSKLQMRISRRLFLSHRRTIVLGEKLAKAGIGIMFDDAARTPESRLTCFLVVTKGKGYDLLNAEPKFERFPSEVIREITKSKRAMATSTKDIGLALSFNSDPILSYLEAKETQGAKEPSQEIQLIGYGQFKGDRMVGIYKNQEANGLMWLRNYVREHLLTFPFESGKDISILVKEGHANIKPILQGDKVIFELSLEAKGVIGEDLSEQDLNKPESIHRVERKFAEQVKKCVQAAIKQMQKEGTDSAQLGLMIWRSHPNTWNNDLKERWRAVFKEAEFRIKVEASITETGLINQNVTKDGR